MGWQKYLYLRPEPFACTSSNEPHFRVHYMKRVVELGMLFHVGDMIWALRIGCLSRNKDHHFSNPPIKGGALDDRSAL